MEEPAHQVDVPRGGDRGIGGGEGGGIKKLQKPVDRQASDQEGQREEKAQDSQKRRNIAGAQQVDASENSPPLRDHFADTRSGY
jgi:hypothetical protein